MDPFTLLLWAAVWAGVNAGIYVAIYFANLTFEILGEWFQKFAHLIINNDRRAMKDKEHLAFTVKNALNTGNYQVAQGIFNTRTEEVQEARAMQADSLDSRIQYEHQFKEVAIWN